MKSRYLLIALTSVAFVCAAQQPNEGAQPSPEAGQMQTRMQEMRALMERIQNTTDPAERQRLMAEHMQEMHDGMTMMGGGMMGGQPGGAVRGDQCTQDDTECRMRQMQDEQRMMGERMGMMQQMMGQMMDHMMAQRPEAEADETPREDRQNRSEPQVQEQDQGHEAHH